MIRRALCAALAVACAAAASAGEGLPILGGIYAFSVEAGAGAGFLQMTETAFAGAGGADAISELEGGTGFAVSAGAAVRFGQVPSSRRIGARADAGFAARLPSSGGYMRDGDWDENGALIAYGEMGGFSGPGFSAEARAGAFFPLGVAFGVTAGFGARYSWDMMQAYGGWTDIAPVWGGMQDAQREYLHGVSVEYSQEWFAAYPYIALEAVFGGWRLEASGALSPLVRGSHIDRHFFRKMDWNDQDQMYIYFLDKTAGGLYWSAGLEASRAFGGSLYLSAFALAQGVRGSRGGSAAGSAGFSRIELYDEDSAGAGMASFAAGLKAGVWIWR